MSSVDRKNLQMARIEDDQERQVCMESYCSLSDKTGCLTYDFLLGYFPEAQERPHAESNGAQCAVRL